MYEITFIVKDEKDTQNVKKILEDNKVKVIYEEEVGRKTFTYPIKKEKSGFYYTYYLEIEPEDISSITNNLNAEKEILRFLILKSNRDIESIKNKKNKQEKTFSEKDSDEDNAQEEPKKTEKKSIDKVSEISSKDVKTTKKAIKKKPTTDKKTKEKKLKPEKKSDTISKEKNEDKSSDEKERIKKLEEKLDELLKD